MPERHKRKKVVAVLLGALLGLLLLEAFFQVGGLFVRLLADRPAWNPRAGNVILCAGDSFTWGSGGESYPRQLERILNRRKEGPRSSVINRGIPGGNSAQLVRRLEGDLKKFRPDLLIVLIGLNNGWNSVLLNAGDEHLPAALALDRALLHLKTYKFLKLLYLSGKNPGLGPARGEASIAKRVWRQGSGGHFEVALKTGVAGLRVHPRSDKIHASLVWLYGKEGDFETALDYGRKGLEISPESSRLHQSLAWLHGEKGEFAKALAYAGKGLDLDPRSVGLYAVMTRIHAKRGQLAKAMEYGQKGLEIDSTSTRIHAELGITNARMGRHDKALYHWKRAFDLEPKSVRSFAGMVTAFSRTGRFQEAVERAAQNPSAGGNPAYRNASRLLERVRRESPREDVDGTIRRLISKGLRSDLRKIGAMAEENGVRLVFCSYPEKDIPEVRETARELGVRYVDFTTLFLERFTKRTEWSIADGHCNTKGYGLMAETLARVIAGAASLPTGDGF